MTRNRTFRVEIRCYLPSEEIELWELFYGTVRTINTQDYTMEQVQAWAPDDVDQDRWSQHISAMNPFVCVIDHMIVGYAALLKTGYAHHKWQRHGVGTALYETLEKEAIQIGLMELTFDVSITARPFFESRGFRVLLTQTVTRNQVTFRNFKMNKQL